MKILVSNSVLVARLMLVLLVCLLVAQCSSLPRDISPQAVVNTLPAAQKGLAADFSSGCEKKAPEGESCFTLLIDNLESLNGRLALIDSAQSSIDIQTFMWARDFSGRLIASRILAAADRGVRVRLLLDDFPTRGSDRVIAALDQHPNIYVRVWNPGRQRGLGRNIEYVTRLRELNNRLHNKVLIADKLVSISGGRNIADAYFGLSKRFNFLDIDLLAAGPVTPPLSGMFDLYWNSPQAVQGAKFYPSATPEKVDTVRDRWRDALESSPVADVVPIQPQQWDNWFDKILASSKVGNAEVIYDIPGETVPGQEVLFGLQQWVRGASWEVLALNPYLVPGEAFFKEAGLLEQRGVDMAIMTNSLGSTNQTIVHDAYASTRLPMVKAGVRLYEMKYHPAIHRALDTAPVQSSWVGLHAKCAVLDRKQVFVGSYNLSPRSRDLNTEMGILVDSPELGEELAAVINNALSAENAWEVRLNDSGGLSWVSAEGELMRQPYQNFWRRITGGLFGLLPLEQHL